MAGKQKQDSGFFAEDDPGMEKHREAGQKGGEAQAEEQDSEYFSEISRLGNTKAQETEEDQPQTGGGTGRTAEEDEDWAA